MRFVQLLWPATYFRTDSSSCNQLSPRQKHFAEGEQRKELGPALGKAGVAGVYMDKLVFCNKEGVLELGPYLLDDALCASFKRMQVALWSVALGVPELAKATERDHTPGSNMLPVGPNRALAAV